MSIPIQVSPATNDLTLSKDQTFAEVVKVTIPKSGIVPKVDAYFLADTTSSMRDAIDAVKVGISGVLTQIGALGADVQFGVGEYKDFPAPDSGRHPYAFLHQHSLSANTAEIQAAIDTWEVTGGRDVPEAQFYALDQLAEAPGGTIGWRADSRRIIVWFGDAAGHDAVCQQISGLSYDITEASVTEKLVAEKIKVLALSLSSTGAPAGLDDDPKEKAIGYQPFCGDPGGTPEQGTRIAKATGGKIVQDVSANTIVETIKTELAAQITSIGNVSLVASGATAPFVVAIAPSDGYGPLSRDQDHEISFNVDWIGTVEATYEEQVFSGSLDVIADGEVVGGKTVKITVEEIPMPRPDDRSGTWMLIHQVSGAYFRANGATLNNTWRVEIARLHSPVTNTGNIVHLWNLVKQTDGTYLIQTFDNESSARPDPLYLQAPDDPARDGFPRMQRRDENNSLQSWVLVPVSADPDNYAIQAKDFPEYALGTHNNNSFNGAEVFVSINRTWGKPTWHHYWRLTNPPPDAQPSP
ncbi:hypothetical protein BJP34_05880 [Moorena producens PAL-8-15-08-1]|uniref:VWFA domain-containing protein n=1 Tax=Moorena producens PAL-8-15-08-1 TaxID=1458985 RepID=A0A1D8TN45_9CYAN|nr:hypothetical protein [Moorena producens]AOW99036.1 hypothetical protein BJP34_05880 [Moorena producens PAL-8-15-08-1]